MTVSAEVPEQLVSPSFCNGLRVALVHDWLTGMRGGEKALEAICELFPDAPLWTLLCYPDSVSKIITSRRITTSWLQHLPLARTKYRYYLPLFPLLAEATKVGIEDADIVISTSHAVAKSMVRRTGKRPLHVCYIHTPMRYAWDRFDDYFGPEQVGSFLSRFLFRPVTKLLQKYDLATLDRVDVFTTNSSYVAEQVKRIYGREAEVIYGPADVTRWEKVVRKPEDWYLMVSALAPYKRVDHAIEACAALGRSLKIVGSGPEEGKLRALAASLGADVEFHGFVTDDQLADFYARGKALIFPGVEDMGLVPLEAISAGCPVVALAEGGVLDTMSPDTAVFYREATPGALQQALTKFEDRSFDVTVMRNRARGFSKREFQERFVAVLAEAMKSAELEIDG
jgi:glycosyltransferase involved in cell wall biosynthesis